MSAEVAVLAALTGNNRWLPRERARLEAGRRQYESAGAIEAELLAREPDATPERAGQLAVLARKLDAVVLTSSRPRGGLDHRFGSRAW